jgi:hypothetical protein
MTKDIKIINLENEDESKFIEWQDKEKIIFSKGNKLFSSKHNFTNQILVGEFPTSILYNFLTQFSILKRLFRFYYYNVCPIGKNKIFVTFGKSLGIFENGNFFSITGLKRPARFLRNACAQDKKGGVYLGEYISNLQRDDIHIYYLAPNSRKLKIVYTFNKNTIRHVHGIYKDPYSNDLWVLTGDVKDECKILKTSNEFKTLEVVGSGNDNWRAVSIQFTEKNLYFGTDAEFDKNYIFKMDRATYKTKVVSEVDGPIYYSCKIKNQIIFAVTAEGCPSQKVNKAVLWKLNKNNTASQIKSYDKDIFPIQLMPGIIHFANGEAGDYIFGYGIGLKKLNHKTIKIQC